MVLILELHLSYEKFGAPIQLFVTINNACKDSSSPFLMSRAFRESLGYELHFKLDSTQWTSLACGPLGPS